MISVTLFQHKRWCRRCRKHRRAVWTIDVETIYCPTCGEETVKSSGEGDEAEDETPAAITAA